VTLRFDLVARNADQTKANQGSPGKGDQDSRPARREKNRQDRCDSERS
jgi:hypothetical protein